jgi:putative transposase
MASRGRSGSGTRIPDKIRTAIVSLALEQPDPSPRELAVNFTDTNGSFVFEASVYRLLKTMV